MSRADDDDVTMTLPLSRDSRRRLSRSGFFRDKFSGCGIASSDVGMLLWRCWWWWWLPLLLLVKEVAPPARLAPDADECADPVDSHSNDSVPLSPRLWLRYNRFFGTNLMLQPTIENREEHGLVQRSSLLGDYLKGITREINAVILEIVGKGEKQNKHKIKWIVT